MAIRIQSHIVESCHNIIGGKNFAVVKAYIFFEFYGVDGVIARNGVVLGKNAFNCEVGF